MELLEESFHTEGVLPPIPPGHLADPLAGAIQGKLKPWRTVDPPYSPYQMIGEKEELTKNIEGKKIT